MGSNWYKYLMLCQRRVNCSVIEELGVTPYFLVFGTDPEMTFGATISPDSAVPSLEDCAEGRRVVLEEKKSVLSMWEEIRSEVKQEQADYYNKFVKPVILAVGDLVIRYHPLIGTKLNPTRTLLQWRGPYEVVKVLTEATYLIKDKIGACEKAHVRNLRKYKSRSALLSPLFNIVEDDDAEELSASAFFPTEGSMVLLGDQLELIGCALSVDPSSDAFQVHYWGTTGLHLPLKDRTFKPWYYDPFSERRVYTHKPPPQFGAMVDTVFTKKTIVAAVYLDRQGRLDEMSREFTGELASVSQPLPQWPYFITGSLAGMIRPPGVSSSDDLL